MLAYLLNMEKANIDPFSKCFDSKKRRKLNNNLPSFTFEYLNVYLMTRRITITVTNTNENKNACQYLQISFQSMMKFVCSLNTS